MSKPRQTKSAATPSIELTCPSCHSASLKKNGGNRALCLTCNKSFRRDRELPRDLGDTSVFVVTCSVSESPIHTGFLSALEHYVAARKAVLLIVPVAYRNPTSQAETSARKKKSKSGKAWRPQFAKAGIPYHTRAQQPLGPDCMLIGDIAAQPTAARPLNGVSGLGQGRSVVIGHPKIAQDSIVRGLGVSPKVVISTGAITRPRYSASKAGQLGDFHHVIAALVIETDGKNTWYRHIHANASGSFYDLNHLHHPDGSVEETSIETLVVGDLHGVRADPKGLDGTFFGAESEVKTLKPKLTVLHDTLDFQSGSHHNTLLDRLRLEMLGRRDVELEVQETSSLLANIAKRTKVAIARSNHDLHFVSWLDNPKNLMDAANSDFYIQSLAAVSKQIRAGQFVNPLGYWFRQWFPAEAKSVRFLGPNDSLIVKGIELSQHGHKGPNGARGSRAAFLKVGIRMIIGHGHAPGIDDGIMQVGTKSMMDMGYNEGMSAWQHCDAYIYPNGKRTLSFMFDGKYHGGTSHAAY